MTRKHMGVPAALKIVHLKPLHKYALLGRLARGRLEVPGHHSHPGEERRSCSATPNTMVKQAEKLWNPCLNWEMRTSAFAHVSPTAPPGRNGPPQNGDQMSAV